MYNKYSPTKYNRLERHLHPPVPIITPLSHTPVEHKPPCSPSKPPSLPPKKIDFKSLKKNTCTSLNDVECFLNNFFSTLKYIKLINLLK